MIEVDFEIEGLDDVLAWNRTLERRAKAYVGAVVYGTAKAVFEDLKKRMPDASPELEKSLQLAQVRSPGSPMYLIRLVPKGRKMNEEDADKVILEVSAKQGPFRIPTRIRILIEYGPWTAGTIPFRPDARYAVVTERRVGVWTVRQVEKDRKADRRKWTRALIRSGGVDPKAIRARSKLKVVSDLQLLSMSYEFGLGGEYKPHWRPALLNNANQGKIGRLMKSRKMTRILNDPKFQGWKKWPPLVKYQVGLSELKSYARFQEKLGIL